MARKLKLYVWEGVLRSYTAGIMFAFAYDVEEARHLLLKTKPHIPEEDLNREPQIVEDPAAFVVWGGD